MEEKLRISAQYRNSAFLLFLVHLGKNINCNAIETELGLHLNCLIPLRN